jgi:hypothetical protein
LSPLRHRNSEDELRRGLAGIRGRLVDLCRIRTGAKDGGNGGTSKRIVDLFELFVDAVIAHFAVVGAGLTTRSQPLGLVLGLAGAMILPVRRGNHEVPLFATKARVLCDLGVESAGRVTQLAVSEAVAVAFERGGRRHGHDRGVVLWSPTTTR